MHTALYQPHNIIPNLKEEREMPTQEQVLPARKEYKMAEGMLSEEQKEKSLRLEYNLKSSAFLSQKKNRNNKDIFRAAMEVYPNCDILSLGGEEIRGDIELILLAVKTYGEKAFQYALCSRRSSIDYVLPVVQIAPCAYPFSMGEARSNMEVIRAALGGCGDMLQYVPPPFHDDFAVVYTAFRQNIASIRYASPAGKEKIQNFIRELL